MRAVVCFQFLLHASLLVGVVGCDGILGFEMNHDYDAGPDTGKDCPKDTCNEALTSWLDYPERCDSKSNECECEPVETACKASPDNECCNSVCSMEQGCVTESGTCPGSVDTCTDTILSIGKVCNGCGEGSAKGTCGPGESFECSDASFTNCQSVSCGGDLYDRLEVGGQREWTASNVCNKDAKDECIPNPCGPCDDADANWNAKHRSMLRRNHVYLQIFLRSVRHLDRIPLQRRRLRGRCRIPGGH